MEWFSSKKMVVLTVASLSLMQSCAVFRSNIDDSCVTQFADQVVQGQVIGYSGNTGASSYPHLHFSAQQIIEECHDAVAKTADLGLCPQAPISFRNASPGNTVLKEWVKYTALSY